MGGIISKDSLLTLRLGSVDDIPTVVNFIENYWKSGHILSRDRTLFEFLYLDKKNLNFVIATETSTGREVALLGFIPTNSGLSRVSLALWKSLSDRNSRSLQAGLASLRFLVQELAPRSLFCVGIRKETTRIYEFMGYSCNVMNHHLIKNPNISDFFILGNWNSDFDSRLVTEDSDFSVIEFLNFSDLKKSASDFNFAEIGKDLDYLNHRYFDHPSFVYGVCGVTRRSVFVGLIVYRRCYVDSHSCIRIIDVIGGINCLKGALHHLVSKMIEDRHEYIDLVSWGLNCLEIEQIGFSDRRKIAGCIVPEFFSPFIQANKDIWFFTNLSTTEQFFRGDGDLDRPN